MKPTAATHLRLDLTSDLQKWRTFLAIAELGSLTRAALFLDSNQSLLSRHLNALERECNARLFNRTGRGVALSDVGERILPHVKALLANAEQLEEEILVEAREPAGLVTIGSLPSITNPMVGRLYKLLSERYPGIRLKVLEGSSGQVEEWMADARIDIAILYRYGKSLSVREQHLATVDSYLIGPAGDRITTAEEVPFARLDQLPFILPSAPNGLRSVLDTLARQEREVGVHRTPERGRWSGGDKFEKSARWRDGGRVDGVRRCHKSSTLESRCKGVEILTVDEPVAVKVRADVAGLEPVPEGVRVVPVHEPVLVHVARVGLAQPGSKFRRREDRNQRSENGGREPCEHENPFSIRKSAVSGRRAGAGAGFRSPSTP